MEIPQLMPIGTTGNPLPVYTESELDAKLAALGYLESSGFFTQNSPTNVLTTMNADHFVLEALAAQNQPWVLSASLTLPFFGKVTFNPDPAKPLITPVFTFYKQRFSPPSKVVYTIITNTSKGILNYSLPLQPPA